jgi:hypothetical protein
LAQGLKRFKPGVPVRAHRIFAASIWTVVGILLMFRGGAFLVSGDAVWLIAVAVLVGTGKSFLMLDKSARKNINRLAGLEDGACLGGVYSVKMWGLVACMILLGRLLRSSSLPVEVIGVIYVAIGWALFFSSRLLWRNIYPSSE